MKIEDQVVSLELAKRLKELGVKQESYFVWEAPNTEWGWTDWLIVPTTEQHDLEHYSAFTVAELGELLPWRIDGKDITDKRRKIAYFLEYEAGGMSVCYTHHLNVTKVLVERIAETEADARAKMLIYLIENGLISNP